MKRKPFLLILYCLIFSQLLHGQNITTIDSLKGQLSNDNLLQNLKIFNQIAWEYRKSYPDSTIYYSQKSIDIASNQEFSKFITQPLNFMGVGYYYKGDNLNAYQFYIRARDSALVIGDSLQYAHSLNNLGRLYFNQGNYVTAYNYFFRGLNVFEHIQDSTGISYGYKSLAELYQTQNNLGKALEMSLRTAEIRENFNDPSGIISIYLEIAGIYVELKNYDKALNYFTKAYDIAEKINDKANLAIIKLAIAEMNTSRNLLKIAYSSASEALDFAEKSNNINLLNKVNFQLGLIYFLQKDLYSAETYFQKVRDLASENNDIAIERDALFYLSKIYEAKSLPTQAFELFKSYVDLKEKIDNVQSAREIERLESRVAIEVKDKENQLLKINEETYKEVIQKQRYLNYALTFIAFLVILLLIVITRTAQRRKKYSNSLVEKNKEIEEHQVSISIKNEEIENQNKKLILRNKELDDLNNEKDSLLSIVAHDLKSPFSRIKGLAELLRLSQLTEEQKQYVEMIKTNSKHGTYLINDLLDVNAVEIDKEDPIPSKLNLKNFLETELSNFVVELTNKEIECKIECENSQLVFTDKNYLHRILDNLLSNAIKFSNLGSQIILRAGKSSDGGFWIAVKDFGQGFSEEDQLKLYKKFKKLSARPTGGESSNGLGLAIVKTLVDRLSGTITLQTEQGKFSEFTLFLPELESKKALN